MQAKTPKLTRQLSSCMLTYEDGSTLELPVEDLQGFHRIETTKIGTHTIEIHEVFITYGYSRSNENDR